jgi:integrase
MSEGAWGVETEAWATAMRAGRMSTETVKLRLYHVDRLRRHVHGRDPWSLTLDDLLGFMGAHEWARETARGTRSSLRAFWRWAVATDRTSKNVALGLPSIAPEEPHPRPAPRSAVVTALREADRRLLLMLRLANDLGMRRGEVAKVHSDDVRDDLLGWTLRVHGKGSRERDVPLPDDLARLLRSLPDGWAFPGRIDGHLSARYVGKLVASALPGTVTMHQLRHLCATELHDATHDLRLVQTVLGHASVATTQRYVAVRQDKVAESVRARSARWSA